MYDTENNIIREIAADLRREYRKGVLSKKETASEMGISISTLNNYMAKGCCFPAYKKIGDAKNAKVVFPILEIAKFLSDTVEVDNGL